MSDYIERYWRDATPADAIKEPPMVARFRDSAAFRYCQVYDAPDPGEGWRLIDVDKEQPEEDDQYLCPISNVWCFCNESLRRVSYSKDSVVRRRIEQPKPKYIPFTWEDREQLRGRWVIDGAGDEQCIVRIEKYKHSLCVNGIPIEEFLWAWRFVDTGEPVGKRVV